MADPSTLGTRLIVTADDFGLSPAVDQGIIQAFEQGVVRSTALLTNFPDLRDSVARLEQAIGLEVGIHLNLIAGPPVLPPDSIPSLVTPSGVFLGFVAFLAKWYTGRIDPSDVMREWAAQIELGKSMGCRFASITSHQHLHMLPALAQIAVDLTQRFKIPAVRLSRFHPSSMFSPLRPKALVLALYAPATGKTLTERHVLHNDFVVDIPARERNAALRGFCRMIRTLPIGVFEVISHPGFVDETLRERDGLTDQRVVDLAVLTAPTLRGLMAHGEMALTTFGELAAEPIQD